LISHGNKSGKNKLAPYLKRWRTSYEGKIEFWCNCAKNNIAILSK
jgi:hypothetical protein